MKQLFSDMVAYAGATFWGGKKWLLDLFGILGIILYFSPRLAAHLELSELLRQFIGGGVFLLSFVGANFVSYRELRRKVEKKPAHITVRERSAVWQPSAYSQGIPINAFICDIHLDVNNEGDEPGRLNIISIERMELGESSFVDDEPSRILWYRESDDPNRGNIAIKFPCHVEAEAWDIRFVCRIETRFLVRTPEEWAKRLNHLRQFSIDLSYEYETMSGKRQKEGLSIQGSFVDFRRRILKGWLREKQYDLFFAAVDVGALLDDLV